jgi:hypothetical protein
MIPRMPEGRPKGFEVSDFCVKGEKSGKYEILQICKTKNFINSY